MKKIQYEYSDTPIEKESIKLQKNSLVAELKIFTGIDHGHWVVICPSVNVSGYGDTLEEAKESFNENMETFSEDLFKLDTHNRIKYIKSLGWKQDKIFNKRYSNAFIDTDGILQNLEKPKQSSLVASY